MKKLLIVCALAVIALSANAQNRKNISELTEEDLVEKIGKDNYDDY